ncbi:MAG TPA: hypothetical protein VNZ03_23345 [Terriglobales bacterium]|nr:hypothetical protein [Terriglobales bacterium]
MAAHSTYEISLDQSSGLHPVRIATFARLRALAWHNDVLYASRGYAVLRAKVKTQVGAIKWEHVGLYRPAAWRTITSSSRLASRLFRDGFHAIAALSSGHLIGTVPHAIVTLVPGDTEFNETHKVVRGTRPLHFATTPNDHIFWGEYFNNPRRDEVHIYVSTDRGAHWDVAYTFPGGTIRHVHNIVYDEWDNCFWVLTGDHDSECRILRASCDFKTVEVVLCGSQQTRSAALVPTPDGIYFSSDTPLETNHVYRLDRRGDLRQVATLNSSSTHGCRVGNGIFFSTMVEPSAINSSRDVYLYGSADGGRWQLLEQWEKDRWPMGLLQYGNAFLPDGKNTTGLLAATTIAVEGADLETSIWRI